MRKGSCETSSSQSEGPSDGILGNGVELGYTALEFIVALPAGIAMMESISGVSFWEGLTILRRIFLLFLKQNQIIP